MPRTTSRISGWFHLWPLLVGVSILGCASTRIDSQTLGEIRGRVSARSEEALRVAPIVVCATPVGQVASDVLPASELRRVDECFTPSFLVVGAGQSVRFANAGEICHQFFSSSEHNDFELELMQPGSTQTVRFDHPGVVRVYCSLHEDCQATVFVMPSPYFGVVDSAADFRIQDLAPGDYVVEAWVEGAPMQTARVSVSAEEPTFVGIELEFAGSAAAPQGAR